MERPDFFKLKNGEKVKLPFSNKEYDQRVSKLRSVMDKNNLDMIILTSMHNIAYYTGFIYCSFGRPYGCVVTNDKISTISANIDASQPWRRSHCENIIYTDWRRDNFLKAIVSIIGRDNPPKNIGIENDHVTLDMKEKIGSIFTFSVFKDVSKKLMKLRMIKSNEEIEISKVNTKIYTSWIDGRVIFRDENIDSMILKLERLYNVIITNDNKKLSDNFFNATIVVEEESIDEVMGYLKEVYNIKYQKFNNKIIIK